MSLDDYKRTAAYISVTCLVLGIIGNAILVRLSSVLYSNRLSSSVFFMAVALLDTIILILESMDDIAESFFNVSSQKLFFGQSEWRCRITLFFVLMTRAISSWLVVALAAETFIENCQPQRKAQVSVRRRALYVTLGVGLVILAACFPFLVITTNTAGKCSSKYRLFFDIYSGMVLNITISIFVPAVFILLCNAATLFNIASKIMKTEDDRDVMASQTTGLIAAELPHATGAKIGVTTVFFVTVVPYGFTELMNQLSRFQSSIPIDYHALDQAHIICKTVILLNYCLKCYITLIFSASFRDALKYFFLIFGEIKANGPEDIPESNMGHSNVYMNSDGQLHYELSPSRL